MARSALCRLLFICCAATAPLYNTGKIADKHTMSSLRSTRKPLLAGSLLQPVRLADKLSTLKLAAETALSLRKLRRENSAL